MLKIGITGGIGSGKSVVCNLWQSHGAYIINADHLAKNIMVQNDVVKEQLIAVFGDETFQNDGSLNRVYLAEEAFNKNRVEQLNSIVHPAVFDESKRLMDEAEAKGFQVAVYEAALLLQYDRFVEFDCILLVLADEEKRIERVAKRDHLDREQVLHRVNRQQNFEKLSAKADFIIWNNGSLKELQNKADKIYQELLGKTKEKNGMQ